MKCEVQMDGKTKVRLLKPRKEQTSRELIIMRSNS